MSNALRRECQAGIIELFVLGGVLIKNERQLSDAGKNEATVLWYEAINWIDLLK